MKFVRNSLGALFSLASGAGAGYGIASTLLAHQTKFVNLIDPTVMDKAMMGGVTLAIAAACLGGLAVGATIAEKAMNKETKENTKAAIIGTLAAIGLITGVVYNARTAAPNGVSCSFPPMQCIQTDKLNPPQR